MKKVFLLLTVLCASALNAAVVTPVQPVKNLPSDVKAILVTFLHEDSSLPATINRIKNASEVNAELSQMINGEDLKGFTKVVHMLANKFGNRPYTIADMFKTHTAKKYVDLYAPFEATVIEGRLADAKRFIAEGVDVTANPLVVHLALQALREGKQVTEMIKLLLANGANPYVRGENNETALQRLNRLHQNAPEYEQIKSLLEDAMKKQQQ